MCSLIGIDKRTMFRHIINELDADIVAGCESHLYPGISNQEVFPSGYTIYRRDRIGSTPLTAGGGVFLMIKTSISSVSSSLQSRDAELISAKIHLPDRNKPLHIVSFYRPKRENIDTIDDLHDALSSIPQIENKDILMLGDFNAPKITWNANCGPKAHAQPEENLLDVFASFNMQQFVFQPTRISSSGTKNILDLVLCNRPQIIDKIEVIGGMSDHFCVSFNIQSKRSVVGKTPKEIYQFNNAKWRKIRAAIKSFSNIFLTPHFHRRSVSENWDLLIEEVNSLTERFVPKRLILPEGTNKCPWITKQVKNKLNRRFKAHKRLHHNYSEINVSNYKASKREAQVAIREAQERFFVSLSNKTRTNSKAFWNYVNNVKREHSPISLLIAPNGSHCSSDVEKCNILNKQYSSQFIKEAINTTPDPNYWCEHGMQLPIITSEGVQKLLNGVNPHKACGPDNFKPAILKNCASELSPILTAIFNQSLTTGELPLDWKKADICPIYKKGPKTNPENYRPISLTSCVCKILEHILVSNIMSHFERNNILSNRQHGFRKYRSCEGLLLSITQKLKAILDQRHTGRQTDAIFLDFAKAFDTVPHKRLLTKLEAYGIRNQTLTWIKAFLVGRTQQVVLNNVHSDQADVLSGVPQGTVLGPCLFLCYINDITETISSDISLFADDTLLFRQINTPNDQVILQEDLCKLQEWSTKWLIRFNVSKCVHMSIRPRRTQQTHRRYYLNGECIPRNETTKYLGITLDENLLFDHHIENIIKQANQSLGLIRRNFSKCTKDVKKTLYTTMVRPRLEYACSVWDPSTNINKIEAVQRYAVRFINRRYDRLAPITQIAKQTGLPTLKERRTMKRLTTFYAYLKGHLVINDMPRLERCYSSRTESHDQTFARPFSPNLEYLRRSYLYKTVIDWNELPQYVINANTRDDFKDKLATSYGWAP